MLRLLNFTKHDQILSICTSQLIFQLNIEQTSCQIPHLSFFEKLLEKLWITY